MKLYHYLLIVGISLSFTFVYPMQGTTHAAEANAALDAVEAGDKEKLAAAMSKLTSGLTESQIHENYFYTLGFALTLNKKDMAEYIVKDLGANINYIEEKNGQTALTWLIRRGQTRPVRIAIQLGANVNQMEGDVGEIPLTLAIKKKNPAIISTLIQAGANPNAKNLEGKSAWAVVKDLKQEKMLRDAIMNAPKIKKRWQEVLTAIAAGDKEKLKQLAQLGDFYLIQDDRGNTPLHLAVDKDKPELAALILGQFPQLALVKNDAGQTPIDLAISRPAVLKVLVGYPQAQ
jgi:ankyrin repeat protein